MSLRLLLLSGLAIALSAATGDSVRQGPHVLQPAGEGVGRLIPDASFHDLDGRAYKLSA